jgi:hypothetical protein
MVHTFMELGRPELGMDLDCDTTACDWLSDK